jgi:uncharacterized protein (TIGR01777 family)
MLPVFRMGLGSPLGSGTQWFPWIHQQDLVNILMSLIDRRDVSGPVNCTAPQPVRNRDMTKILGEVIRKPVFMPAVPSVLLKVAMGELGTVLLKGQRALPKRLLKEGFKFPFPTLKEALKDIVAKA